MATPQTRRPSRHVAQTPNVICLPYLFADLKLAKKLMIDVRGKLREVNEKCTAALREKMKQHIEVLEKALQFLRSCS